MSTDSEIAEMGQILDDLSKAKRASNRENSPLLLRQARLNFASRNNGAHIIVQTIKGKDVDFWPGTGKWIPRTGNSKYTDGRSRRGVFSLIEYCKAN
jgi:hypothetical protein